MAEISWLVDLEPMQNLLIATTTIPLRYIFESYEPYITTWFCDHEYDPARAAAVLAIAKNGLEYDGSDWSDAKRIVCFLVNQQGVSPFARCKFPAWTGAQWQASFNDSFSKLTDSFGAEYSATPVIPTLQSPGHSFSNDQTRAIGSNLEFGRASSPGQTFFEGQS